MKKFTSLYAIILIVLSAAALPGEAQTPGLRSPSLGEWRVAFNAVDTDAARLLDYQKDPSYQRNPLFAWLEAHSLLKNIRSIEAGIANSFLQRYSSQPATQFFRTRWLKELAKREDWSSYLTAYQDNEEESLRCTALNARLQLDRTAGDWQSKAIELWMSGKNVATECDPVFERLELQSAITEEQRWQRIDLAIKEEQPALIRTIAKKLPGDQSPLANSYADFILNPHHAWKSWPRDARSRQAAATGLRRLAKKDPASAESQLGSIERELNLSTEESGSVRSEIAIWTVASYGEKSAERIARVPDKNYDTRMFEWRTREAMNRRDFAGALRSIELMPAFMRSDARWQYYEARLREIAGQKDQARALFTQAATSPTFFGFLAADKINAPYALCPIEASKDPVMRAKIETNPALLRALALFTIEQTDYALREWSTLLKDLSSEERKIAIEYAIKHEWFDRAVFSIGSAPEDLRHYRLRFPLHHEDTIRDAAKAQNLDAAWVAAQTRAESSFMPNARSGADARGLMQLLPGTGALMAARLGMPWRGGDSLYNPDTNITYGTAYLRNMLEKFEGLPYVAIAAYNAGPTPIARWRAERGDMDADLWIETIPYKETREYVARVLAFSVIYDWRLEGNARPITDRMFGRFNTTARRSFACPATATAP